MKKTCSPRNGSLPRRMKRATPMTTVIASASNGDAMDMTGLGWERGSSFNMIDFGPQPRHPRPHLLDRRCRRRDAHRHSPLRNHHQSIANFEQLIEFFTDDEHSATLVAQREQFGANLRRRADVYSPSRLRDDQQLRLRIDLPPDDELLQVAARQARRSRLRSSGLDLEALDDTPRQRSHVACMDPTGTTDRFGPRQQRVLRE